MTAFSDIKQNVAVFMLVLAKRELTLSGDKAANVLSPLSF